MGGLLKKMSATPSYFVNLQTEHETRDTDFFSTHLKRTRINWVPMREA